jgi:hypothetical protein
LIIGFGGFLDSAGHVVYEAQTIAYVEYRAVSGVFQNINPSPPPQQRREGTLHTRRPVRGWGVNILEDARHWILASYSIIPLRYEAYAA